MKVNRTKLLKQLEAVVPGLSRRGGVEQSGHFVFQNGKLLTYNDEVACVGKIDLDLEGAVPSKELLGLLRKLVEDEIELKVDGGELKIAGTGRKAGIRMDAEIALPLDAVEKPGKWKKLPPDFWEAIKTASHVASTDESQFILTCIHLTSTYIEATDHFQLIRCKVESGLDNVLLKAVALRSVTDMMLVGISETENWVHFHDKGGLVLSCRKYEGQFPKLDLHIKVKGTKTSFPKGISDSISKAVLFSGEEKLGESLLRIDLQPGKMRLSGQGPNGWYRETSKVEYEGGSVSFSVAPNMLLDISRRADTYIIGKGRIKVTTDLFEYVSSTVEVGDSAK